MTPDRNKWQNHDWMDNPFWGVMAQIWRFIGPVVIFLFCAFVVIFLLRFGLFGIIAIGVLVWVVILFKRANQDAMGNV